MKQFTPVIKMSIQRLACTACGAEANASCNCGKPYVPKEVAKEAIKANPEKSNRTIAEEIGTSEPTVRRAREELGASGDAPERRGSDGKTYPVKKTDPVLAAIAAGTMGDTCIMRVQEAEKAETPNPISGAWERATPKERREFVSAWWVELLRLNKSKTHDCDQCRKPGADLEVHYGESSAWLHRDCQDAWRVAQDA